jgi:hypothetical protein
LKTSEVIAALQAQIETHGDLECRLHDIEYDDSDAVEFIGRYTMRTRLGGSVGKCILISSYTPRKGTA